ncbi:MAG: FAD-binding oxidoreductase [Anaerolineae bacterium]|nr:FAD-binding oxidoreductase [Anaerolineae bacterium]
MLDAMIKKQPLVFDKTDVVNLQQSLSGQLLQPGDPNYDDARRLWNGAIDKHPAFIVRCQTGQDVALAIQFARKQALPVSVRSGGHNTLGLALCDDGLVIDLSSMKAISVDPVRRIAHAQPGLTLREFVQAVEGYGLLTTTGTCAGNGLGGATLGGGIGWLMGKYGLIIDNVRGFEMVTAAGELLTVNAQENSDLFWGLRGGGGNFGIVTNIDYQLHPVGKVLAGMVIHPMANAQAVMRFYRDFSSAAPDELTVYAVLASLPDIGPAILLIACYCGSDMNAGEKLMAPLRQFGSPIVDTIKPMPYSELLALLDPASPDGRHYHDTAYSLVQASDDALESIITCAQTFTSPFSAIVIHHIHGAATRVPVHDTAFALREPHYAIVNAAGWEEGLAQPHIAWAEESLARMRPFAGQGVYVNFMGYEQESAVRDAYRANYERLVALKTKYDPTNFFQLNQNIKPAPQHERGL